MVSTVEIFPWTKNFETGIQEIDEQHRTLIGLLNQLASHLAFQSDAPTLNAVFEQLRDYAAVHFKTEEDLWSRHFSNDDPWALKHHHAHTDFIAQVLRLKAEENIRPLDEVLEEIVTFLTHWLGFHILEADQRMAHTIFALSSGVSLEQAKRDADEAMSGATRALIETIMSMYDKLATRTVQLTREIVRRKKSEHELRLAHSVYRHSLEAILVTDSSNLIIGVNPAFTQITGYTLEEVQGRDPKLLASGRHGDAFYAAMWQSINNTGRWQGEIWNRRKDGTEYAEWLTINTIYADDGKVSQHLAMFFDMTELKRRDEELVHAKEQADRANRAKSEFLANMSHEIRTPMNGILGMTELALDTQLNPEQRGYLQVVKTSADSLLTVINDILDFSKLEAGKLALENIEFPLAEVIYDVCRILAVESHQKGLELICALDPATPQRVRGDPNRLRQVLMNLLGNAIKFTETGEIELTVKPTSQIGSQAILQFSVRDTGIGVPPEKLDEIFSEFAQADNSVTRRYGGTGLGLTISRRLVDLMEGRIWVISEPGRGSTFSFTAKMTLVQEEPSTVTEAAAYAGKRVLLAEENVTSARHLCSVLRRGGVQVVVASGVQATESALRSADDGHGKYHAVIANASILAPDATQLLATLRETGHSAKSLIVMQTANRQNALALQSESHDIALAITKPVNPAELLSALGQALAHEVPAEKTEVPSSSPMFGDGFGEQALTNRMRVMLVEDNPINQIVATKMLERLGCDVVLANNGREAVEKFAGEPLDLVFMDVQMPVLGGLDATMEIRAMEADRRDKDPSARDTPIIAMTAHAMQGDRERCLAAGMDDYLTKPIYSHELLAAIERMGKRIESVSSRPELQPDGITQEERLAIKIADLDRARIYLNGNEQMVQQLLGRFLAEIDRYQRELDETIEAGDAAQLSTIAHSLKSTSGIFGAEKTVEAALAVETAARASESELTIRNARVLREELTRLGAYLAPLRA